MHFDETGVRVEGTLMWVHNSSTTEYTYQTVSEKRGMEGMDENGVITGFRNFAVHDCLSAYFKYRNIEKHGVCCAHILRELEYIRELEPSHVWPGWITDVLLELKAAKEAALASGLSRLTEEQLRYFGGRYDCYLGWANQECPPKERTEKRRGRPRKGKERSLIERLYQLKESVLRFATDFVVPFDNNQAERDLRNLKTKTKVSGCFRTVNLRRT